MPIVTVPGQVATGSFTGTSGSATLPGGTTAGSTVILVVGSGGAAVTDVPGFVRASPVPATTARGYIFYKLATGAGETAYTVTSSPAAPTWWYVEEVTGVDPTRPVDVGPLNENVAASAAVDTFGAGQRRAPTMRAVTRGRSIAGATAGPVQAMSVPDDVANPTSSTYDGRVMAVHVAYNAASSTVPTWSGQSQGLSELADGGVASGATAVGVSVSAMDTPTPTSWDVSATASATLPTFATHVVFNAAGARHQPNIEMMAGMEWGTTAGWTTGSSRPFDGAVGPVTIVATNPRSGSYCLEMSTTAAQAYVAWTQTLSLFSAPPSVVVGQFCVFFPSALPGGAVILYDVEGAAGDPTTGVAFYYRTSGTRLGVSVGGGTELFSSAVAADTWHRVDYRARFSTSAATCEWQLDGVDQPTASGVTYATAANLIIGWAGSFTATVRYDDLVVSKVDAAYPLGNHRIYPLRVDPAGTVTLSGTSGNFQTFTANGTTAAWNATTARDAVDELPVTVGASADGFVQVANAAADYVEVPMESRDCASLGESIRGLRWYFTGWAASAAATNIGLRAWDGTVETTLWTTRSTAAFTNSTTTPTWVVRPHRKLDPPVPYVWTQTKLDALAARVGFSTEASNVKIGVHAIMAELAVRPDYLLLRVASVSGVEGTTSTAYVDARLDPDSGAVLAYLATPAPDFAAVVSYVERGSPVTTPLPAGAAVAVEIIGADTVADVTNVSIGAA